MFFVMRKRHIALFLSAASCLVILAAIWWESGPPEAAETMGSGPSAAPARVIVIDAGHGGADGGAVADDGTTEAEINLAVAKKLEAVFDLLGCETVMVRQEDVSIHSDGVEGLRNQKVSDIHNRVELVNSTENSILVSIHQNSLPQVKSVHGAQVFYNAEDGAAELATIVQQALNRSINPGNEKQEKPIGSSVYLMAHIDTPGILVECGFLSNAQETQQLKEDTYQTRLALSIAAGYLQYETTDSEASGIDYEE